MTKETNSLTDLAARCEAAEGPDRELDALIRCALFAPAGAYVEQSALNGAWVVYSGAESRSGRPHIFERWPSQEARNGAFTASLDAAMTLVPEGSWDHMEVYRPDHQTLGWTVHLLPNANLRRGEYSGFAQTYALALCAAALRAWSAQP